MPNFSTGAGHLGAGHLGAEGQLGAEVKFLKIVIENSFLNYCSLGYYC